MSFAYTFVGTFRNIAFLDHDGKAEVKERLREDSVLRPQYLISSHLVNLEAI
jgi:hypothetical protein